MDALPVRRAVLVTGLVLGLSLGLIYTWVINPVELINTYPALLRTDYRWDWVRMVALSYVADSDLERVGTRLDDTHALRQRVSPDDRVVLQRQTILTAGRPSACGSEMNGLRRRSSHNPRFRSVRKQ